MSEKLKLVFDVDDKGSIKLNTMKSNIDGVGDSLDKNTKIQKKNTTSSNELASAVGALALSYVSLSSITKAISDGFEYNKMIEDSKQGLQALIVATSENVDAMGQAINTTEKYAMAMKDATSSMAQLEQINARTPHTIGQTVQIYKAMYVSMKSAGASTDEMINLTEKVSIAAGSAGIEFNSLLAGVDGLASGTVLANSDLGRFLSSLGLTNDAIKSSDDVVGLLSGRLKEFKVDVNSMSVVTSNFDNSWQKLTGTMTKDSFEASKGIIKETTDFLTVLNDQWHSYFVARKGLSEVNTLQDLNLKLLQKERDLKETIVKIDDWMYIFEREGLKENAEALREEIKLINEKKDALSSSSGSGLVETKTGASGEDLETNEEGANALKEYEDNLAKVEGYVINASAVLDPMQGKIDEINLRYERQIELLKEVGATEDEIALLRSARDEELGADKEEKEEKAAEDAEKAIEAYTSLLERKREVLDAYTMSEEEMLNEKTEERVALADELLEQELVTKEDHYKMLLGISSKYEKELGVISSKGYTERQKFASKTTLNQTKDVLGMMTSLTSGLATNNKTMFNINKAAALANAGIAMYEGISLTLSKYPFPISAVMAGLQAAAGAAQISSITSSTFEGGGSTSAPSIGGGFSTTAGVVPTDIGGDLSPETTEAPTQITINLGDDAYMRTDGVRLLIEQINEEIGDGATLVTA